MISGRACCFRSRRNSHSSNMTHICHCSAPRPHAGLASRSGSSSHLTSMFSTAPHLQDRTSPLRAGCLSHQKLQVVLATAQCIHRKLVPLCQHRAVR